MERKIYSKRYISLAPRIEKKVEYEEYYRAIDFAMKDKTIKNIAITGSYGAGKSSVIESYFNCHKEIKAINISLAKFGFKKNSKENDTDNKDTIESEIMKCMFYAIDGEKLKQSQFFNIKKEKCIGHLLIRALIGILFIISFLFLNNVNSFIALLLKKEDIIYHLKEEPYVYCIILFIIGIISLLISIYVIVIQFDRFLPYVKAISLKGIQATLDDESVIDKNLHEIINLVYRIEEKVFIFEDLDRCNNSAIFEKLRNLCIVLNNNELIKEKCKKSDYVKCVKFIFAVKDELIYSDETKVDNKNEIRTKFFDFIIPIIPMITQNNISDDFTNLIKDYGLVFNDKRFISDISLYINNRRIMNNIINEFNVYKGSLIASNKEFDDKQLLTLIVYKNINPVEFKKIQERDILYKLFSEIKQKAVWLENKYQLELAQLEKKVYPNQTIEDTNNIAILKEKILILKENKKAVYEEKDIFSIIAKENLDSFIVMAIKNQYINKNYYNYINYFYEGQLSLEDRQILKKLLGGNEAPIDEDLHNVSNVYNILGEAEFSEKSIYNLSLLKYAINEEYAQRNTKIFVTTILNNYGVNSILEFLQYVDKNEFEEQSNDINKKFLRKCLEIQPKIFDNMNNNSINDDDRFYIANKIVLLMSKEEISQINNDNELTKIVSLNVINISKLKDDEQRKYLENFDFDCEFIEDEVSSEKYDDLIGELIDKIVKNKVEKGLPIGYYNLLKCYIKYHYNKDETNKVDELYDFNNYDYLINNLNGDLLNNLNENLDLYVEQCLLKTKTIDLTNNIVNLLYRLNNYDNVKGIIFRLKGEYDINSFKHELHDDDKENASLDQKEKSIYKYILINSDIKLNLNSLYEYYLLNGWDKQLTDNIIDNFDYLLGHHDINDSNGLNKFYCTMIIKCKEINDIYMLLNKYKLNITNVEFASLPIEIKNNLVNNNNLTYNKSLISELKTLEGEALIIYLTNNINAFIDNSSDWSLSPEEVEKIIVRLKNMNNNDDKIILLIDKQIVNNKLVSPESEIERFIIDSKYKYNSYIIQTFVTRFTKEKKIRFIINKLDVLDVNSLKIILNHQPDVFSEYRIENIDKVYRVQKKIKKTNYINRIINKLSELNLIKIIDDKDDDNTYFQILY